MKRWKRMFLVFVPVLAAAAGVACAETIQLHSKIADVNASDRYLKVYYLDPQTQDTEEIRVGVEESTLFQSGLSLEELKEGDEISVEADFNAFTHEWKAQSIGPYKQA